MSLREATLSRYLYTEKQTLGTIGVIGNPIFFAKSLELAWQNNESNISCIPVGRYLCKWTRSNRISRESLSRWLKKNPGKTEADAPEEVKNVFTYEVMGVPGRAGIRIHSANYFFQLRGCIALGSEHKKLNLDEQLDVTHSGDTCRRFAEYMGKNDFYLIIR